MKINPRLRLQILVQNSLFVILLIAIVAAVIYLTKDIDTVWDLTQSKRNTLSQASIDVLEQITEPISITAFATPDAEEDLRGAIQNFTSGTVSIESSILWANVDKNGNPTQTSGAVTVSYSAVQDWPTPGTDGNIAAFGVSDAGAGPLAQ